MEGLITPEPLRVAVRRILLERLLSGMLEPGSDIKEVDLAEELGVSRTPIRQALLRLEFEGFLDSSQGKGFSVAQLSTRVALELYPLVGLLEAYALRTARSPDDSTLAELESVNARRGRLASDHIEERIELDDRWHELLISSCDNSQLHEVLGLLKMRLYRYEHAIADRSNRLEASTNEHSHILKALRKEDRALAGKLLEDHWNTGVKSVEGLIQAD